MPPKSVKNPNYYLPYHITAGLKGAPGRVGEALSDRAVLAVKDESGRTVKGFFTANTTADELSQYRANLNKFAKEKEDERKSEKKTFSQNGFERLYNAVLESGVTPGELADALSEAVGIDDDFNLNMAELSNVYVYQGFAELGDDRKREYISRWNGVVYVLKDKLKLTDDDLERFGVGSQISDDLGHDIEKLSRKGREFIDNLDVIYKSAATAKKNASFLEENVRYEKGGNVNLRNNAAYDYAALLGIPDSVARSVPMTLVNDGTVTHGSFMLNAKGASIYSFGRRVPGFGEKDLVLTGKAVKELSDLQVLDFLCGNVDRHAGNVFFDVDTSDPANVKIVGAQGIDNDASFGTVDARGNGGNRFMSRIGDIKVIDDDLARKVVTMSPADMEKMIRRADLSADEIKAAHDRLGMLKKSILDGKITRISEGHIWDEYASRGIRTLAGEDRRFGNVFGEVNSVVEQYNERKPNGSVKETVFPEARAMNGLDKYSIMDQIVRFRELENTLGDESALNGLSETQKERERNAVAPVKEKLGSLISDMTELSGHATLSADERTSLLDGIAELTELTGAYAAAGRYDHAVKNLAAFAGSAADRIRDDAVKAHEAQLAASAPEAAPGERTLSADAEAGRGFPLGYLIAKAPEKTNFRGSSVQFDEMVRSLNMMRTVGGDMPDEKRLGLYARLLDSAETYLNHKIPNGSTEGLNSYERSRVEFADQVRKAALFGYESTLADMEPKAEKTEDDVIGDVPPRPLNVVGRGDCYEYDPVHDVVVCFRKPYYFALEESDAMYDEFVMRLKIRNGGEEPDGDMMAYADALNSGDDAAELLEAANEQSQEAAIAMLNSRKEEIIAFDASHPILADDLVEDFFSDEFADEIEDGVQDKFGDELGNGDVADEIVKGGDIADGFGDDEAEEELSSGEIPFDEPLPDEPDEPNAPDVPEEVEEAPIEEKSEDAPANKWENGLGRIAEDVEEEELGDGERTVGDVLKLKYERAYDTIRHGTDDIHENLDAMMTVMAYRELYRGGQNDRNEEANRQASADTLAKISRDPGAFEDYKEKLWQKTSASFRGDAEDYVISTVAKLRAANENRNSAPDGRTVCEEEIAAERDANLAARTLHGKDDDFAKGQKLLEEQREKAYGILASDAMDNVKDEARITIATCHFLTAESDMGRTVNALWAGKRDPGRLSLDDLGTVNRYIDTVKEIGKDPRAFIKHREETRRELAPYFSVDRSLARDYMREPEKKCVKTHFQSNSALSKHRAEDRLVGGFIEYASAINPAPGVVERYLSKFDPSAVRARAKNVRPGNVRPVKKEDVKKEDVKVEETVKQDEAPSVGKI